MIGNDTLGCDPQYEVWLSTSCGDPVLDIAFDAMELKFNYALNAIGSAELAIFHDDCSVVLRNVTMGKTYLLVVRNQVTVFHGPVVLVRLADESVRFVAHDPLWWASRRLRYPGGPFTEYPDPVSMFEEEILARINEPDFPEGSDCALSFTPACFQHIYRLPGGERTAVLTDTITPLVSTLSEMTVSVHFTVVGRTLLYGYQGVPIPGNRAQSTPLLTEDSWLEPPEVDYDLTRAVDDVTIQSALPAPYRKSQCGGEGGYHQVFADLVEINSVPQVDSAATDLLNSSLVSVVSPANVVLSPDVGWDIPRMIPGMEVELSLNIQGIQVVGNLKLYEVSVELSPAGEQVSVSLGAL